LKNRDTMGKMCALEAMFVVGWQGSGDGLIRVQPEDAQLLCRGLESTASLLLLLTRHFKGLTLRLSFFVSDGSSRGAAAISCAVTTPCGSEMSW
jgi:hypothetical protein